MASAAITDLCVVSTGCNDVDLAWTAPGAFDAAVDALGRVYVTDSGNNRVQVFDPDGIFLDKWGEQGGGDGELGEPFGIAVGADGTVYVVDIGNHCVLKFTPTCP
jgi:DNA-binding beta-propeller fold protein YncE